MVLRPAAEVAVIRHASQTSFNTLSGREAHQNTGGAAPPNVNKDVALSSMAVNQEEVVEDQVEADMKIPFRERLVQLRGKLRAESLQPRVPPGLPAESCLDQGHVLPGAAHFQ